MINRFRNLNYQQKLFFKLLKKLPEEQQLMLKKAFRIAQVQHLKQLRKEDDPYLIHPLRMAVYLLKKLKVADYDFVAAALLHDTIEDGNLTVESIRQNFYEHIAYLVKALTRISPPNETEEQKKINKQKKFNELLQNKKEELLIKAVDLLDNLKSWPYIPQGSPAAIKFPRWKEEAKEYYLKIAQKAHPQIYRDMKRALPKVIKKVKKIHNL